MRRDAKAVLRGRHLAELSQTRAQARPPARTPDRSPPPGGLNSTFTKSQSYFARAQQQRLPSAFHSGNASLSWRQLFAEKFSNQKLDADWRAPPLAACRCWRCGPPNFAEERTDRPQTRQKFIARSLRLSMRVSCVSRIEVELLRVASEAGGAPPEFCVVRRERRVGASRRRE